MFCNTSLQHLEQILSNLYNSYNKREFIHPDPLEFIYQYDDMRDREIVGLLASSLAYGRVSQILKSISTVLEKMGPSPFYFLENASLETLLLVFGDFKHRFTTADELAAFLCGIKTIMKKYGSLNACFKTALDGNAETIVPALCFFAHELSADFNDKKNSLLPCPSKGSACKRLNLFLRWMVRKDDVDPGVWHDIPSSRLIVPLDTHMHRISLALGFTKRKQADMKTTLEITDALRKFSPHDPVKYDFALTRLGIWKEIDLKSFLNQCGIQKVA